MNKYALISDHAGMPMRINALPELQYPERFNVTKMLFDRIDRNGWSEVPALLTNHRTYSFAELQDETSRYAAAFRDLGVRADDRIIIRIADTPELVFTVLAVQALGAIAVATFAQLRHDDLVYRVRDTGARLAVVTVEFADEWAMVAEETGISTVMLPNDPTGRFASLDGVLPKGAVELVVADTHADDIAVIAYTSGTTGRPKGCAQSHRDLLAATDTYCRYCVAPGVGDVFIGPPSIPFTLGMAFFIYYPLWFGAGAVLLTEKSVEAYATAVRRHRATIFVAVPTYYNRLMRYLRDTGVTLDSLRMTLIGGEPLYPELEDAWRATTGLPLIQFIGSTEMFHIFISYRHGSDDPRSGVLGRAIPGYEVTVRASDTFEELPNGEHGLMCVRGPTATVYWSPREIQSDAVRDGWNIVQDTVWKDDDGYIHFVARRDEMIVSGGFNIAPADVEQILIKHPSVLECACVPSPDDTGERSAVVKAFIVPSPGYEPTMSLAATIQAHFKANGPAFMYPRKVEFVDALPKGITGKILRSDLRRREMGK